MNTKGIWLYVREQTQSRSNMQDLLGEDGNLVIDSKAKADLLNKYFASVFVNDPPENLPDFDI